MYIVSPLKSFATRLTSVDRILKILSFRSFLMLDTFNVSRVQVILEYNGTDSAR